MSGVEVFDIRNQRMNKGAWKRMSERKKVVSEGAE